MAQVHPFRALRYNPDKVAFDRVLTQPYDKISPAAQERYYASDPNNLIAVEKGRVFPDDNPKNNVYTRAKAALQSWIDTAVVQQDHATSLLRLLPGVHRARQRRHAAPAAASSAPANSRNIPPASSSGTSTRSPAPRPIASNSSATPARTPASSSCSTAIPQRRIDAILADAEAVPPVTTVKDEYGVTHRLWVIWQPDRVAAIQKAMADQKLVIADGHHRYETALNFRNEQRKEEGEIDPEAPHERAMMTFVNTRSEGLTILPTHRVVANLTDFSWPTMRRYLEPFFAAESFPFADDAVQIRSPRQIPHRLVEARAQRAIGVYPTTDPSKRAYHVLTLRPGADLALLLPNVSPLQRELDVVLLHEGILEPALGITPQSVTNEKNLTYEREATAALDAVDKGAAQVAFLLNPCDVDQVMNIATSNEVMPQKSTDFYPKLLSGITMYRLDA